ncbi:hypothetical protein AWZ03_001912 [Drosophila navojoa]|uniref:Uncharacterized protein n=1 Tax=Drosophila navojoa TaxID=7232 RepID=A0A484BUE9_DRONA|nr:uncharacterized protein LOC108655041 isoform X1 [Drosophila navojoa]XP_030246880.1 uncharacterized protein LOC108655041 isoform X2 [Drosophila navojoa]TDG51852.1 hypothetical protein AWZ03_001912 [Drosophila navojoa]
MEKLFVSMLILICYGWLLGSCQAMLIRGGDGLLNATDINGINNNNINSYNYNNESALPVLATALGTAAVADRQQVKNASEAAAATAADITATTIADKDKDKDMDKDKEKDLEPSSDLSAHLHRNKRRMSAVEALHHGRRHSPPAADGGAAPPYVYYNKMISPDGKQELKEFQLMSPNMVIESVQHDMNYGPAADLGGGVLLLNSDNNLSGRIRAKPPRHHHKHKSSLALPPFLFLLQQMLQPNLNIDMEPTLPLPLPQPQPQPRSRLETPLYQFLDSAVDNALRNNHEVYEHFINEHDRDNELSEKDNKDMEKDKDIEKEKDKLMDAIDMLPMQKAAEQAKAKEDELLVSCPIHHEHRTNINGDVVNDDVVLVNECHII